MSNSTIFSTFARLYKLIVCEGANVMKEQSYAIDFTNRAVEGKSTETWRLEDVFFNGFEEETIEGGDVLLHVTIEPLQEYLFELTFSYEGNVVVPCDRCLDPLRLEIKVEDKVRVHLGDALDDENDEDITLDRLKPEYDFSWIIYELLLVHLPIQRMHEEEECNPEITKYLVGTLPKESEEVVDPRWEELRRKFDQ